MLTRFDDDTFTNRVSFTEYAYAADGRLEELEHRRDDGFLISTYNTFYDDNGRVVSSDTRFLSSDPVPTLLFRSTQEYRYDASGQLTHVGTLAPAPGDPLNFDWAETNVYRQDNAGNRTETSSTQVGRQNRLLQDDTYVYRYDGEGNLTIKREIRTGVTTTYEWDHRGRLLSAETTAVGGAVLSRVDYQYDALGRRVAKETGGDATGYVFDGQNEQFELDLNDAGRITRNYLYGPGVNEVVAVDQEGIDVWMFADALGTVRTTGIVNNPGDWFLVHRNFDRFGNQVDFRVGDVFVELLGDTGLTSLVDAPVIYAGHRFDEDLGLYSAQARLLDPSTGRFLSTDPILSSSNLYRYAAGDPVNNVDPNGQFLVTGSLLLLGAIGTGVAIFELMTGAVIDFDQQIIGTMPDDPSVFPVG